MRWLRSQSSTSGPIEHLARMVALPTAIIVLASTFTATAADAAGTPSPEASDVVVGLLQLSHALGSASAQPALSTDLPLTDISVRSVLDLDTAIGQHVTDAVTGADADLDSLPSVINADPALHLVETTPTVGAPADSRDWLLSVDLKGAVPVALKYDDDRLHFGTADLSGKAAGELTGTLRIRYDGSALPLRRFSVVGDSELTTHVWTRPTGSTATTGQQLTADAFPAVDGFVRLLAGGTGTIDTTTVLRLRDPNGRGALTTEDFEFGSADEMFATKTPPAADDVQMHLDLSSDLLSDGAHGSVVVGTRDAASTAPYATPIVTRDSELDKLTALTRAQALTGFAKYTTALLGAESSVDAELPLLTTKLSDLYSPGNQLLQLLTQQATATIKCGAADTSPPTGAPRPGEARYCQATTAGGLTVDDGTSIAWASPDSGVTITGNTAGTVGSAPTANVTVTGGGGFPVLTASFTSDGTRRTARTLIGSIQDLSQAVSDLGLDGGLTYDPDKQSLEVAVRQDDESQKTTSVTTGGNGNLAPLTGLTGLCQAEVGVSPRRCPRTGDAPSGGTLDAPAAGQADVTTSGRQIDATFGIGLVPPSAPPAEGDPAPATPVTYVKPGANGLLWRVGSVTAAMTSDAAMLARIGFLQVDVDVTDYHLTTTGTAAAKVTVPTGDVTIAGGTVGDAVDVARLLGADPAQGGADPVDTAATRGLTATAHLVVKDSPEAGTPPVRPLNAQGTIDATWTNLTPGHLPSVTTGGAYDRLRLLDLVPSRQGTMGTGTDHATMVDANADFYRQFGLTADSPDKSVTRQLYDTSAVYSDSTVCTDFTVVDAHTLTCTKGPLAGVDPDVVGHPDVGMTVGDSYVINGNPTALRDVLIDDIAGVLTVYTTPDASLGAGRTLPLVDLLPSDVSAARASLSRTLVHLQQDATGDKPETDVSSLQGFASAIKHYAPASTTTLSLPTGTTRLLLDTSLVTPTKTTFAPLRLTAGNKELRVVDGVDDNGDPARVTLPLSTSSNADLHLAVDLSDASSYVGKDTSVGEQVTGLASSDSNVHASLAGKSADYGSTAVKTGDAGDIAVGIGVQVDTGPKAASATWIPISGFRGSLEQVRSVDGDAQTCGGASGSDIAACASLPLVDPAAPHATLTTVNVALKADESSGGSGANLDAQPLAYRFLTDGLGGFSRTLSDALNGDDAHLSLPMVGTDLDAGADIPSAVTAYTAAARAALTNVADPETTSASDFADDLTTALNAVTVADISHHDTTVVVTCHGAPCGSGDTIADVTEVTAPLHIGGNKSGQTSPFRAGLAGMALDTNLQVPTTTDWSLDVTVGIQRGSGPFLVLKPSGSATDVSVLTEHVTSQLPDYSTANCHAWDRAGAWEDKRSSDTSTTNAANTWVVPSKDASATCIDAFVGKLPSVLVDRKDTTPGGHHTGVDAHLTVAISPGDSADDAGRVYLPAIFDKKLGFTTSATGTGGLAVYFESYAASLGFFDVMGTIDLDWKDGAFADAGEQFGHLEIDANSVYDVLDTGYAKAKKWMAPLNPVVDVLSAPIPVVSQMASMVGAAPVSLMSILVKAHASVALIANLLEFQQLIARLPGSDSSHTELVGLGSGVGGAFHLSSHSLQFNSCTKTAEEKLDNGGTKITEGKSKGTGAAGRCDEGALSKIKRKRNGKPPEDPTAGKNIQKKMTKSVYFSLPSITVPVLQDANQVYDLLLDSGDATMLYVDLGHLGAKVSMVRNFGPFMIGPVPVVASIGGTVGIDGRMAFGFDTRGLSKQIELVDPGDVHALPTLSRGQVFSDGFFIDDLENGVDVPEIQLTFTIEAGASVSIGFAEAGLKGGVTLDLSLDAFDPNNDGKIYTDEFAGSANGPDCAFNVSSGLVFFLQFYFHIDLLITSIDKSFDIVRSPRIKLFEFNCTVVEPKLAVMDGNGKDLWLTMGSHVSDRHAYNDTVNEKYTVHQVATTDGSGTKIEVSAFNLVQDYTIPAGGRLRAEGLSGDDTVKLLPGQILGTNSSGATTITDVPFTAPATIDGGTGNDTIVTGDGADVISGGTGNDSVDAGAGADSADGQSGNDAIDGGAGRDDITGGAGDDRISGGAAADEIVSGDGDDVIDGGVGALPTSLFPTTDPAVIAGLLDAGDLLVGGLGSDQVTGGDGSDIAVGGSYDTSEATFTDDQTSTVYGVTQTGHLTAVKVTIKTVTLPTLAAVRAECADPGATGDTGHDDVTGGGNRDYVIGGAGDDTLSGGGAGDVVCGRGGDDVLDGDGSDVVPADQGDDEVRGGPGGDRLYGSGGADDMYGDAGDDLARGGDGADSLSGGSGADVLVGEAGADAILGDDATSTPTTGSDTARLIVCSTQTSVVNGGIDLNADLSANALDDGQLEGLQVTDGTVLGTDGTAYTGMLSGIVFSGGKADLDGNGTIEHRTATATGDTGVVDLAGMTGAVGDGDCLLGGDDVDALNGQQGGDYVDAGAGDDAHVHGGSGDDLVRGGVGADTVHGDNGADLVAGDAGDDVLYGDAGDDTVRGSSGNDLLAGGSATADATDGADQLLGDGGDDVLAGGNATLSRTPIAGTAITGRGVTLLATPAAGGALDDQLFGGYGADWVFGQSGDDHVFGGPDDDVVEGGSGDDLVQGDDGNDLLVGGSSTDGAVTVDRSGAGLPDGNDTIVGDHGVDGLDGSDILAGDNARLDPQPAAGGTARTRWARIRPLVPLTLFDVVTTSAPAAGTSGDDTMSGDGGADLLIGQSGDDTISGNDGADAVEGNAGADVISGNDGADELLGGSWTSGGYDVNVGGHGDTVSGDAGNDVVLGDNGTVTPQVRLLDAPAAGAVAASTSYGDDTLSGGTGDDTVFGQGGDDRMHGDDGLDALEGDAGADRLYGDAGDDALTGGSSASDGVIDADRSADGQLDGVDTMSGGTGDDVLAGDNARIDRPGGTRADGTTKRTVSLFDVEHSGSTPAGAGDALSGNDGRDLLFGQGGNDTVSGGDGDDVAEGNAGDDIVSGDGGEDDLVGGGSATNGVVISATSDRLLTATAPPTTDSTAAGLVDGNDTVYGGTASSAPAAGTQADSADVVLGDNGRITRNSATISGGGSGVHAVRQVAMADTTPGVWSGSDALSGQAGDDELYGQFDNTSSAAPKQSYAGQTVNGDVLDGGVGDDALVGDQGVDVPTSAAAMGAVNTTLTNNGNFVSELVRPVGTLVRKLTQTQPAVGGDDLLLGGTGFDSIHAGAGADVVNAGDGDDVVFGGDGADAIWGGLGHDRLFGGTGDDLLDIKKRVGDPAFYAAAAPGVDMDGLKATVDGLDTIYGGSGHDALQADEGDQGKVVGDRLIDWTGVYNLYLVCGGAYGAGKIQNKADPSTQSLLTNLAEATGSVGAGELALVGNGAETSPGYPGAPGHFSCEAG